MTSPLESPIQFLSRHAADSPYLGDIEQGLLKGSWSVQAVGPPIACSQVLDIYEHRARRLRERSEPHPSRLREDIEHLCGEITQRRAVTARWWAFNGPDGKVVLALEEVGTLMLLGCLSSYDRRRVSEQRWRELWGPDSAASGLLDTQ